MASGTVSCFLKRHSQLMYIRIRYHFLADLHVKTRVKQTGVRNTLNKPPCENNEEEVYFV